jgi:hypothetical protein
MSQPILRTVTRRCGWNRLVTSKAASENPTLVIQRRLLHSSQSASLVNKPSSDSENRHGAAPVPPEPQRNPAVGIAPNRDDNVGQKRLADFDLNGRVFIVTGGARGLGLALAEALVETGGKGEYSRYLGGFVSINP